MEVDYGGIMCSYNAELYFAGIMWRYKERKREVRERGWERGVERERIECERGK
jgi:hypothetical protein